MRPPALSLAIEAAQASTQPKATRCVRWLAAPLLVAATAAVIVSRETDAPYLWTAIASVVLLSSAVFMTRRPALRALWMNLVVVVGTFGAAEAYMWLAEPFERRMEYSGEFFIGDEMLGYRPAPGQSFSHRTSVREGLLYRANYTINADGLRAASPEDATTAGLPCVAFFGDSFTFGEGVDNDQTMPYQVWKRLGGRYRVVNFGFLGYGPHQMLAALQDNQLESRGHCRPQHVIYQTIPAHLSRSAGLELWDSHGPRYVLEPTGRLVLAGHFDDAPPSGALDHLRAMHRRLSTGWKKALERSALYRTLLRSHRPASDHDLLLYSGIIGTARNVVEEKYPDVEFHLLLWDYGEARKEVERIERALEARRIDVTPMSAILPDFPARHERYEIHPDDRHPNALAHELIARYVAERLVGGPKLISR
ncbi:MAG TPA: hypothetical protein VFS39_08665 [Nitrospira sp.]|nr:hypothetical protein [Nitrospira sp.]